jgi:hypothetical protein
MLIALGLALVHSTHCREHRGCIDRAAPELRHKCSHMPGNEFLAEILSQTNRDANAPYLVFG